MIEQQLLHTTEEGSCSEVLVMFESVARDLQARLAVAVSMGVFQFQSRTYVRDDHRNQVQWQHESLALGGWPVRDHLH